MWRKALVDTSCAIARRMLHCQCMMASGFSSSASYAVNSMILRSLKDHYVAVSKMTSPPKISPPSPYTVVKGALDSGGPVLHRTFKDEEINISVMRLVDVVPGDDNIDESINQLFVHAEIAKPGLQDSLHFLCGLYPDALGIHSVSLRSKIESSEFNVVRTKYSGPVFEDVDEKLRDAFHGYIDERGITEGLFPFLQAWLYVKDHKNLLRWFKTVGTFVNKSGGNQETLQT